MHRLIMSNYKYRLEFPSNVVVTPLRKAASYEQRQTNLGNQNFRRRIIHHVVPRNTYAEWPSYSVRVLDRYVPQNQNRISPISDFTLFEIMMNYAAATSCRAVQ